MYQITNSPLARQDLKDIWHYTYNKWGEKQASKYLIELGEKVELLIENPELGIVCTYITKYRQYPVNHHITYYRIDGNNIIIVRVLHEMMDPKRHL
jgi:toxin ParE1/3/4